MCGRATIITPQDQLEQRFNAHFKNGELLTENTNICAGEQIPVITCESPSQIQLFSFGYTPHWAHQQTYLLNARSEGSNNKTNDTNYNGGLGIFNTPMFRHAIRSQRCLVLVDAFIEGSKQEKLNKPYIVYPNRDRGPFAIAGIYDQWINPLTGRIHHTVAIVTTTANRLINRIGNHRSPVILDRQQESIWINPTATTNQIAGCLKPFDPKGFNAYPISQKIKKPYNKGLELLKPVGEKLFKDYDRCLYDRFKYIEANSFTIRQGRLVAGDQFLLF